MKGTKEMSWWSYTSTQKFLEVAFGTREFLSICTTSVLVEWLLFVGNAIMTYKRECLALRSIVRLWSLQDACSRQTTSDVGHFFILKDLDIEGGVVTLARGKGYSLSHHIIILISKYWI